MFKISVLNDNNDGNSSGVDSISGSTIDRTDPTDLV
jgi:hypothetical protein